MATTTNNAVLPNVEPSIAAGIPLKGKKAREAIYNMMKLGNDTNWRKENVRK